MRQGSSGSVVIALQYLHFLEFISAISQEQR